MFDRLAPLEVAALVVLAAVAARLSNVGINRVLLCIISAHLALTIDASAALPSML